MKNGIPTCEDCAHFRQHYVRRSRGVYMKVGSGHCVRPRRKPRYNDAKICDYFKPPENSAV